MRPTEDSNCDLAKNLHFRKIRNMCNLNCIQFKFSCIKQESGASVAIKLTLLIQVLCNVGIEFILIASYDVCLDLCTTWLIHACLP